MKTKLAGVIKHEEQQSLYDRKKQYGALVKESYLPPRNSKKIEEREDNILRTRPFNERREFETGWK